MISTLSAGSFVVIAIGAVICMALLIFNARKEITGSERAAENAGAAISAAAVPDAAEGDVPIQVLAAAAYYCETEK